MLLPAILIAVVFLGCSPKEPAQDSPVFSSEIEVIAELPDSRRVRDYAATPDHRRVVFSVRNNGQWSVREAGVEDALDAWEGQRPTHLSISPSGTRIAYVRRLANRHELVVDGTAQDSGERFGSFVWSAQRDRFGCFVQDEEGGSFVNVDGERSQFCLFLMTGSLSFSPNGMRYAYLASTGMGMTAFVDGIPGDQVFLFVGAGAPVWNATGTSFAYDGRNYKKRIMVLDNQSIGEYVELQRPVWDPTGKKLAYPVGQKIGPVTHYIIDQKVQPKYDALGKFGLCWSQDGKRFAYVVRKGKQRGLVVDGTLQTLYDDAIEPRFSPDGKRVACWVIHKNGWHLLLDGKRGPRFGERGSYVPGSKIFSPNSQEVAYGVREPGGAYIIRGSSKGPIYRRIGSYGARFDPSGKHVVCAVLKEKTWGLDIDGVFYGGLSKVWNDGQIAFHSDGTVSILGQDKKQLIQLRVDLTD